MRVRPTRRSIIELLERRLLLSSSVIFVDQSAGAGGNGSSWASAYADLQTALQTAGNIENNDPGTALTIEVAQGTYYPTNGNDQTATVQLLDDVAIFGGYASGGSALANPAANPTILSGQIGATGGMSGESFNVVTGSGVDVTAVLDGFTIEDGNADGDVFGENLGGGMLNDGGSPTVENCIFTNNGCSLDGGGMANLDASPTISDCTFLDNTSIACGGMVNLASSPVMTDCTFIGNTAAGGETSQAGGLGNLDYSSPTLINCLFLDNTSPVNTLAFGGGGMLNEYESSPTLINCSFSGNSASEGGAMDDVDDALPIVINCIYWNDSAPLGSEINDDATSASTVSYSDVDQTGYAGSNDNIDADPVFVSATNLQLQQTSPCVNAGSNAAITATGVTTDLAGNPRMMFGTVDMGAYELQPAPVSWTGAGGDSSWSNGANWSNGLTPDQFNIAQIGREFSTVQISGGAFAVYSLSADSDVEIQSAASLHIAAPSVVDGLLSVDHGGTLDVTDASLTINYGAGLIHLARLTRT